MQKGADAYRSIGEAAKLIGVAPHVLRYWEGQFPQLKPVRRPDGRRYYRPDDVRLAAGLAAVLREDGLTTRGAAKLLAEDGGAALRARGAARLPETFGGDGGPPASPPPKPTRPARAPARRATAPKPPKPAQKPAPQKPAPGDLPLFPDLLQAARADSSAPAVHPPLARLARLAAHLRATPAPAPAQLQRAAAHLRAQLAQPGTGGESRIV